MTVLWWCLGAWSAGVFSLLLAQTAGAALADRRTPVQVLAGRVFPHPADDRWAVTPGLAQLGDIHVWRRATPHSLGTYTELAIGGDLRNGLTIVSGKPAERYLMAIEAANRRREMDRALEAIP